MSYHQLAGSHASYGVSLLPCIVIIGTGRSQSWGWMAGYKCIYPGKPLKNNASFDATETEAAILLPRAQGSEDDMSPPQL
mmetsp:Transcript_28298/g.52670  ORF Transcript_28298/g.52670 Transcript_28298/m.52670 type:complete len:80 (-) Transcript_28298:1011-1250(-)